MATNYYQLKIQVKNIKPSVYRTIIVPDNISFLKLHEYIQELFGLDNYHLWSFSYKDSLNDILISLDDDDMTLFFNDKVMKANKTKLNQVLQREKQKVEYWYDFGDDWRMAVEVQKILQKDTLPKNVDKIPHILKMQGPMLLEDVGGPYIFMDIMYLYNILKNKETIPKAELQEFREYVAYRVIGEESEEKHWKQLFVEVMDDLYDIDAKNIKLLP